MTNPVVSRRTMLRGLGVSMALPWMESLSVWGADAQAGGAEAPVRLAVLFAGNGFHSQEWWAEGAGTDMKLGKVLEPIAGFREKLLVVKGLYNEQARKGNIHSSQTGNLLSGAPLASGGDIRSGTSIDQLLAQRPSPVTALNRAVAVARVHGPAAGLTALDELTARHRLDVDVEDVVVLFALENGLPAADRVAALVRVGDHVAHFAPLAGG